MERALMISSMIGTAISIAVLVVWVSAHAIDPPNHVARSWMQVTMFDPTPWGASFFDPNWGRCPK